MYSCLWGRAIMVERASGVGGCRNGIDEIVGATENRSGVYIVAAFGGAHRGYSTAVAEVVHGVFFELGYGVPRCEARGLDPPANTVYGVAT